MMDGMNHIQSKMEQARNSYDIQGLNALREGAQQNDKKALEETAKQFESIFVHMMLKSMRAAEDVLADENSPFNSQQVKFYRGMHDQQLASNLSANGSIGLADVIVQQLDPQANGITPAGVLRNNGNLSTISDFSRAQASVSQSATASAKGPGLSDGPSKQPGFSSAEEFVQNLLPIAEEAAKKIGLDPKAMLAQAAVETGWGQHLIHSGEGQNSHNLFGVKASRGWQGEKNYIDTLEFENGTAHKTKAVFRSYSSFADSMNDYVDFLKSSPRYKNALENTDNPASYFNELQKSGYATDPAYAEKVMSVYNSDRLKSQDDIRNLRAAL